MKRGLLQIALVAAIGFAVLLVIALATVQAGVSDGPAHGNAMRADLVEPDAGPDLTAEIALILAEPGGRTAGDDQGHSAQ